MPASTHDINKGLAAIRRMRRLFFTILLSFFPVLVLTMAPVMLFTIWLPIMVPVLLFFLGMLVQKRLQGVKCPQCNAFFFVQTVTKDKYTPCSSISFPPQKTCQHCGIVLYR